MTRKVFEMHDGRDEFVNGIWFGKSGAVTVYGSRYNPDTVARQADDALYEDLAAVQRVMKDDDIPALGLNVREDAR